MSASVALCLDEVTHRNPELVGLGGEALDSQPWLAVLQAGEEARQRVSSDESIVEAWVVSCDDIEPVNLAATLKADRPELCVRLVSFEVDGSLFSRAHTALIDEVANAALFARRYAEAKSRYAGAQAGDPALLGPNSMAQAEPAFAFEPDASPALELETVPSSASEPLPEAAPGLVLEPSCPAAIPPEPEEPVNSTSSIAAPVVASTPVFRGARAFLMPIVSGSGGAGKSSVSVVGAHIAQAMGHRTLLLDYDLQFGDVKAMAGQPAALAVNEAIAHPDRLEREIACNPGLVVLAAPDRLEAAEEVVKAMPAFLDQVMGAFDVIVANTGAAWGEQHAVLLERSSAALFLVDQRASSVRACLHALELCERCGIASGPFQFALNRCAKNTPLTSADVSNALNGFPIFEIKEGGRDVEDYLSAGAAADLLEARNDFCTSLEHVLGRLLPAASQWPEPRDGMQEDRRSEKKRGLFSGRKRGRDAQ